MITFEEQLQQTENDNSIIGKKSPKVQTLSDVANTGVYSANDWIELPETKATSGEIIREGLRASQYQLNKIPTELKATMGQAMMSPESVLKIIPFTSMPTMITEQAKVKIFGGTKEADFNDFTGKTRVKQIGKELVQAAYRELKEKDKQYAQRATPLTEEETDTWKYGIASGIGNYGPMLAIGYLTGGVGALSFAVAQEAGQKTEEKLDYYTQKTGDTELKGYTGKQAGKDLALTSVYTAGMGIMEKYIGIGKQMKLFKMSGGEHLKNIALTTLSEGLTEGLEDLYASGIDLVGGYIDTSKLPERYMQAVKSAVIGGLLGGTAGIGTAMAHRSQAKLILRKQYEKTIPAKDIDKVVNAIYDSTADTLQKVVATELVNSESLRNKHGELYNSLKREISNQIKASGAYADVDEAKLANYIESVAKLTADNALGEANKRGVLLQDVLDSTKIKFENGELRLAEKPKVSKLPIKKAKSENVEQVESDIENIKPREKVDLSEIKEVGGDFVRISGKKIPVDYEIVEAKDLLTSNDELGNINKDYPQYLQNRDRARKELVLQVNSIAENIEPERLGKNVVATEGAPIVMGDNIVAMGNGRAQAVKLAYAKGKAEGYKEYLKQQGFNIDGFDKPVLVRKMRGEYSENVMRKLIEDANIAGTSQFSVSEQAIGDAQKISRETISLYDAESELDTASNRKFLLEAFNEIIPETERGRYLDDAGNITQEGIKRVKNATLAYVMPDKRVLSSILETEDEVIRKASQAIMEASPSIVSFENDIDTGNIDKSYSILDDIRTAFNLYSAAKKSGSNVRAYIKNLDMFNDYTPAQQQITNWFVETKNAGELRNRINNYIQNARVEGDTKQGNIFSEPLTKQELLNKVSGSDMEQKAFADSYYQIAYENAKLDAENPAYDGETITINGKERTVYNSNGDRIAKSKEALENFYRWFGDSKVVDKQGRPLVVYHGTLDLFNAFSKEKIGARFSSDERGFFFVDKENIAKDYATSEFDSARQGYIMPLYISASNPLIVNSEYARKNGLGSTVFDREDSISFWDNYQNFALEEVDKNKNDGVIIDDGNFKMVVAFNPNQIKSTSNRGTYSASDNIYYQMSSEEITENLLRDIKKTLTKPVSSEVLSKTISTFNKTQGGRGYTETGDSVQAEIARSQGLATAQEISKAFKNKGINISISTIENSQVADEWHHIGKNMKKTNFYDVENFDIDELLQEQKQEIREKERDKLFKDNVKKLGLDKLKDDDLYKKYQEATGEKYGSFDSTVRMFDSRRKAKNYLYSFIIQNTQTEFEQKNKVSQGTYSESENIYYQSAFAGSRVDYDRPSLEAIGSGEGAQAHGWGLYYALNKDVAERYKDAFIRQERESVFPNSPEELAIKTYLKNDKNKEDTIKELSQIEKDEYKKFGTQDENILAYTNAAQAQDYIRYVEDGKLEKQIQEIENSSKGQVHEVDIPENPYLLDEELTFRNQSEFVQNQLKKIVSEENLADKFEIYQSEENPKYNTLENSDGEEIYKTISEALGSDKAASQLLEKYGIKGITYDGRQDGRCFVIFNPEDVKVIQKFYQINHLPKSKKEIIKGSFDALTKSIKITSDADFSTYQHEFAHFWLDNMFNYAHSDLASENYKKDFKAIEKWLKYDDTRQSYLTRQQHEQFARGYEKFLYKGEVANPIIGKAYNDYENFIREVYSSMTEIDTKAGYKKYKAVPAKVYEFFNNMVRGELPNYGAEVDPKAVVKKEVEDTKTVIDERNKVIAENKKNYDLPPIKTDNTSGYMSETAKPKNIKPIENIEDKSVLTAYAKTMGEDMEAGRANLAKDYATATEFVNKNPELAGQIVRGEVEAPTGMLKNSIYMAYNELQKKLGNTKNRAESALNQALELRRYGQEIASQRLAYMSEINPEYWIGRILTSKASQLAKENRMSVDKLNTTIKEAIESGMAENKTPKEIAKELREELGVTELYQTEIAPTEDTKSPSYNYIYKYVNEQLGLGMKEADAMEILRRTDDMWANIENSKAETGNPSIEYFEKLKALEDFANTLAPSSNLRVFVSVISPGSLLLNIKSSLTNIISNLPTGLMRAAVRRIRLGQMTSLVSPEKIALNKHYVWEVFAKTGYNITDMTELTPESKYHGEEITHSQGKGALRALGRWYEKVVYKWSLGAGDIFYKNLAFNDYASLLATKLANGDAKVANDLFDDAIRIEPLTQYGKAIRRMARDEALIATYQNDTALSKSAMKLRDATDFGVGLSKFFIPFVKTPANVIDLGLKTGFGSFKAIVSEVHRDMKAGKILKPTKENIELCIENGLGFALGFALSSMFDDDDYMPAYSMASAKDKQLAKELNIPFNSVRIGDTWFNLDYLGPLAVPLVGILNARREKDIIEKIGAFGKAGLMQIAALPAFGEIDDLMQKIEQYQHKGVKESAEQFVDNLGETIYSRIVPSIVNDVAKVLDGYDRERKGNEIITQIPFARENAPLKYNVTSGRPEEINQWWGIFTGARVKTQVVNSVAREFERLNNTGNGVSLTPVTRSGLLSSLSDNKKQQVNKEFAKEYAKQVSALIKTYKYKNSNDEDKKDMIDKIRRKIVKELKQEYLQK